MVVLFDGICNLCNGFVQYVLKRDKADKFQFASLQSSYGTELQKYFGIHSTQPNTILLFDGKKLFSKSDAVIRIVSNLNIFYKIALLFKIVPRFILDLIYDLVAKNRYRIFGKSESCYLPSIDISYKFLDKMPFNPLL